MDPSFNFILNSKHPLSKSCIEQGFTDFASVCHFVQQLPYGRNTNRSDFTSIIQENKGTCSTKHAFLKALALENNAQRIKLCLGIYKMKESNTKGIGAVLTKYNLEYIPEAHTYLKHENNICDFTRIEQSLLSFNNDLLIEEEILPHQIGEYKINVHRAFIKDWIVSENSPYSLNEIWTIREACIAQLSI